MKLSEVQLLLTRDLSYIVSVLFANVNSTHVEKFATVEIYHYLGIEFVGSYNYAHSKVGVVDRLPRVSKISCYSTVT